MERLGDGGGGEEHPVQIVAVLTQSLAGDEAPGDGLSILIPLEIYIQIDTLAGAVIGGAEDIRILGDLPAILPVVVQQKILVRQVSHALQPVLQLLEYLLRHRLAGVLQLVRVSFRGFPPLQFNNIHLKTLLSQPPSWQLQGRSSSGNIQHMAVWFRSASTKSRHAQSLPSPLTVIRLGRAPSSMAMARSYKSRCWW